MQSEARRLLSVFVGLPATAGLVALACSTADPLVSLLLAGGGAVSATVLGRALAELLFDSPSPTERLQGPAPPVAEHGDQPELPPTLDEPEPDIVFTDRLADERSGRTAARRR